MKAQSYNGAKKPKPLNIQEGFTFTLFNLSNTLTYDLPLLFITHIAKRKVTNQNDRETITIPIWRL